MLVAELSDLAHAYGSDSLDDLRKDAVHAAAFGLIGAGGLLLLVIPFAIDSIPRETWLIALALAGVGVLTRRALAGGLRVAVAVLSVGLTLAIVAAAQLFPLTPVVATACLVVIFTGALLGWREGLAAAIGESVLLVALMHLEPNVVGQDTGIVALLLIWCCLPCSWVLAHPAEMALNWSWYHYARTMDMAEELRDRQGALGRLSKSLNETCESLEQLNHELDLARQAAEDARKLKTEFAAWISHELRTPLNLIIGFSEMLDASLANVAADHLPQGIREDVEVVHRNASHISALVDDILDLSQIDADRMALQRETVSLREILDEALAGMSAQFRAHRLALAQDVPSDLPRVYVDPTRIRQILVNLLMNALRYTDEGGVTVSATRQVNDVTVVVKDTGAGIAPADLPSVFDEFQHGSPRPGQRRGNGLGLTVSRRFVEMHGGSMGVESKLGEGSRFWFTIPLTDNVVARPYAAHPAPTNPSSAGLPSGPRLVVFDQNGATARVLQRYLDDYVVLGAQSFDEISRLARDRAVRGVLVGSCRLRDQLHRFRTEHPELVNLPVITCSLRTTHFGVEALPVSDYLIKPITSDRLHASLRRIHKRFRRVLVTEDDPDMSRLLVRWVRAYARGAEVVAARDGEECWRMIQERVPDLLLLDLLMPRLSGYEVIERIRSDERLRDLPTIVITARGDQEERVTVSLLQVDHSPGLPVGVAMRCLKANLDYLRNVSEGHSATPSGATRA